MMPVVMHNKYPLAPFGFFAVVAGLLLLLSTLLGLWLLASGHFGRDGSGVPEPLRPIPVSGILRLSLHTSHGEAGADGIDVLPGLSHRALWVNGPYYAGVADNDLRGFLDGRFLYGRNQANQVHVRIGRRDRNASAGEWELFRILQRWDDVQLPPASRVISGVLEFDVEVGADHELDLLLYDVRKEWGAGKGGVNRDNVSAPARGEVWWNEAKRGIQAWASPGAGFASDVHPEADTGSTALAHTRYSPGDKTLSFAGPALSSYIQERASRGEPLLFLVKLSDYHEDIPGTFLNVYSSNHGDSRNTARRPRLQVEWVSDSEIFQVEQHITLEHGRSFSPPRISAPGIAMVSGTFIPDEGYGSPRIFISGGQGEEVLEDIDASVPAHVDWEWVEVRLETYDNPIPIGQAFEASTRDTWVTVGPPEEQNVLWEFISPSGVRHEVGSTYMGDFEWKVVFIPRELGRWRYRWKQHFTRTPFESAVGVFDVIPGEQRAVLEELQGLVARIQASNLPVGDRRVREFGVEFMRLERALMGFEGPGASFSGLVSDQTNEAYDLLDLAREAMSGMRFHGSRLEIE